MTTTQFFHLPQVIKQEDGSRDDCVRLFNDIDADNTGIVDLAKFTAYIISNTMSSPSKVAVASYGSNDSVAGRGSVSSRMGRSPYGEVDDNVFVEDDDSIDEDNVEGRLHVIVSPSQDRSRVPSHNKPVTTTTKPMASSPNKRHESASHDDRIHDDDFARPHVGKRAVSDTNVHGHDTEVISDDECSSPRRNHRNSLPASVSYRDSSYHGSPRNHKNDKPQLRLGDSNMYDDNEERIDLSRPVSLDDTQRRSSSPNRLSTLRRDDTPTLSGGQEDADDNSPRKRPVDANVENYRRRNSSDESDASREMSSTHSLCSRREQSQSPSSKRGSSDVSRSYPANDMRIASPLAKELRNSSYHDIFQLIDRNGDGELTLIEFIRALRNTPAVAEVSKCLWDMATLSFVALACMDGLSVCVICFRYNWLLLAS